MGDEGPWHRSKGGAKQYSDAESSAKPTSWAEMMLAFEASYLSADAVARSVEQPVTLRQDPNESVTSYANRHRDRFNLNREDDRQQVQPFEALQIGVLERGLLPELS